MIRKKSYFRRIMIVVRKVYLFFFFSATRPHFFCLYSCKEVHEIQNSFKDTFWCPEKIDSSLRRKTLSGIFWIIASLCSRVVSIQGVRSKGEMLTVSGFSGYIALRNWYNENLNSPSARIWVIESDIQCINEFRQWVQIQIILNESEIKRTANYWSKIFLIFIFCLNDFVILLYIFFLLSVYYIIF